MKYGIYNSSLYTHNYLGSFLLVFPCPDKSLCRIFPISPRTLVNMFSLCVCVCVCVCVRALCGVQLCNPMDYSLPGFSIHWIFQAKILEQNYHFLLQEIFLTQGLNPCLLCLLHLLAVLYHCAISFISSKAVQQSFLVSLNITVYLLVYYLFIICLLKTVIASCFVES